MSCCLVYSGMIMFRSRLLSIITKSQLQSDRTTEIFIFFQNYCAVTVVDHVYQANCWWTVLFAMLLSM
jgi:hypothetical protein